MNKDFIKQEIKKVEETLSDLRKKLEEPEPPQKDIEGAKKWLVDFLNENFQSGKATVKVSEDYMTYYVDGQWVFQKDRKNRVFRVYYYKCWVIFYERFNLEHADVRNIIAELVLKPFGCEGYTPCFHFIEQIIRVLKPFDSK